MLKCLILEDEPLAMKQIQSYVNQTHFLSLVSSLPTAVEALDVLEELDIDLIFADINMPELSGVDFVKSLVNPPLIIFTTAYSEYAIEGFKVDAVDYLLKPIGYPDFLKAANKAREKYLQRGKDLNSDQYIDEYLFIRSDHQLVRIKPSDIKYIEGMREYIRIHLFDKTSIMTLLPIKTIENRLLRKQFMRVHRSYIINIEDICSIKKQRILLNGNVEIPLGSQYKEEFERFVNKNIL